MERFELIVISGLYLASGLDSRKEYDGCGAFTYFIDQVKKVAFLSLSYVLGRIIGMLQLAPLSIFAAAAEKFIMQYGKLTPVSSEDIHDLKSMHRGAKWYINSGTWIPIYELSAPDVQLEKTYTFLYLKTMDQEPVLERWNGDAGRAEPLVLKRKGNV